MRLVRENINFEKKLNPLDSLKIGLKSWDELDNGDILRLKSDIYVVPTGEFFVQPKKEMWLHNAYLIKGKYFKIIEIEVFNMKTIRMYVSVFKTLEDLENPTFENHDCWSFYAPLQRFAKNFEILSTR